ncbi:MAG: benzoate-CoA ligase family protein [Dethiobacter sp.]|nr:MAG: benzoate-CoA ligase family protein [Dethiobacter sp.]
MLKIPEISQEFNLGAFLLDRHIQEGRGEKVAVYYRDKKVTYAEIVSYANRVGNVLQELGVEIENRVMFSLPDCPEFLYVYFGAMRMGAVPVPVTTMALPADYRYYLNDSRAKVFVTTPEIADKIKEVQGDLRHLKHFIVLGEPGPGQLSFEELIESASDSMEIVPTSKDDMCFWLYSSGTTGRPKGVVHLHHDLLYYMPPYCTEVLHLQEDDICFSASKMYFSYGRNNSIESPFLCGAAVVLEPELPKPEKLVEVITKYKPTIFFSIPTSYAGLLNLLENTKMEYDFSSLRLCISAGEALPKIIFDRWKKKFGLEILDGVGSTDVGVIYLSNLPGKVKPGSSGILLPGFEGKLLDEHNKEVPLGEIGTFWVKNDGTTPYYWNNHEKSKENIHGEWFNTGDKFYMDEEGFYWYAGRADDMLKAGGIWVSPLEIEGILLEHPAVFECAVVGAPDSSNLEKPLAFVVVREGYEPSPQLEQELKDFVRSKTAHYKYPRWIKFVNDLPRTASGKVQRYKLRVALSNDKSYL